MAKEKETVVDEESTEKTAEETVETKEDEIFIRGLYYSEEKKIFLVGSIRGKKEEGEALGITLAKQLRDAAEKGETE